MENEQGKQQSVQDGRQEQPTRKTCPHTALSRRSFLTRMAAVTLGSISARGFYELLDDFHGSGPQRALAASTSTTRGREQYLIQSLEVILDNGVTLVIPPLHTDVITAKLSAGKTWNKTTLQSAQTRLANALNAVEQPYPATAAGVTIVVGWGLPYFRTYTYTPWQTYMPVDVAYSKQSGATQAAVLDAIAFPSDPSSLRLEDNHIVFKLRSDSQSILQSVEKALFDDPTNANYIGDLFDLTSKRTGFLGRGFGTVSIAKQMAVAAGVPGATQIPDNAQLMMGFTSTQTAALGPLNIPSFETLPNVTNQWSTGYFVAGCAMHLSHLYEDLATWYNAFDYGGRVKRMFSAHTVPSPTCPVTLSNGPSDVTSRSVLLSDASTGCVGHNETLQQATRLQTAVIDNYGRQHPVGTPVPVREDFNTLDNPFAWSSQPAADGMQSGAAAGLHFAVFVPTSKKFHTARLAMDGILPNSDGTTTNLSTYNISTANNGINEVIQATHRQNFLVPPRAHRSFPLAELL